MGDAIFRFHETKNDNPIIAATNLFGNIINIHPFEDGNGRICRLILAHVLIQMKCCLFPVILSSFHRRGRRHYIRAVKIKKGRTRDVLKKDVSIENKQDKHELEGRTATVRPLAWPKKIQPDDYYINEEGMYELLFSSQQPKATDFRKHCFNVLFPHVRQQLTDKIKEEHQQVTEEKDN